MDVIIISGEDRQLCLLYVMGPHWEARRRSQPAMRFGGMGATDGPVPGADVYPELIRESSPKLQTNLLCCKKGGGGIAVERPIAHQQKKKNANARPPWSSPACHLFPSA